MIYVQFVKRKIGLIQDDLAHLKELEGLTFDQIAADYTKQAILERTLEKIIVRAIDINNHLINHLADKNTSPPKSYKETFLRLADLKVYPREFGQQVSESTKVRNMLVHEYDETDYQKIYNSVVDCVSDYHRYCQYILDFLVKQ